MIPLTSLRPEVPHSSLCWGRNENKNLIRMERVGSSKIYGDEGDAGNPGPVYGQKDQAPTQGYKQPSKTNDKEETRYTGTANEPGQTKHPGRQTNKQRKHKEKKGPRGKGEGRGRTAHHRPKEKRERQKRKRSTTSGKRDNKPSKTEGGVRHSQS